MNEEAIETIVECMSSDKDMNAVQRIQTAHRLKLVQAWGIRQGSRVLEIGCGQGDTTAALAYVVGEAGFVHGVDIAAPDYGAPITVGDAARYLRQSVLGKQIHMEFNVDVLAADVDFPKDNFDYIVFSHCSWYLKSFEELEAILKKVKKWGKHLCFAEWDTRIQSIEQYPHFLAVLIQAQYECFKESSLSNIRTLFTPDDVKRIAESAGWRITTEQSIHSPQLQDARWEIAMTLDDYKEEISKLSNVSDKLKLLIQSEVTLLEQSSDDQPMSTYVFCADRS